MPRRSCAPRWRRRGTPARPSSVTTRASGMMPQAGGPGLVGVSPQTRDPIPVQPKIQRPTTAPVGQGRRVRRFGRWDNGPQRRALRSRRRTRRRCRFSKTACTSNSTRNLRSHVDNIMQIARPPPTAVPASDETRATGGFGTARDAYHAPTTRLTSPSVTPEEAAECRPAADSWRAATETVEADRPC